MKQTTMQQKTSYLHHVYTSLITNHKNANLSRFHLCGDSFKPLILQPNLPFQCFSCVPRTFDCAHAEPACPTLATNYFL